MWWQSVSAPFVAVVVDESWAEGQPATGFLVPVVSTGAEPFKKNERERESLVGAFGLLLLLRVGFATGNIHG